MGVGVSLSGGLHQPEMDAQRGQNAQADPECTANARGGGGGRPHLPGGVGAKRPCEGQHLGA